MDYNQGDGVISENGGKVELGVAGLSALAIQLSGTWSATVAFEGTVNGTDWVSLDATPLPSGAPVQSATANAVWFVPIHGLLSVRCRASAFTSGDVIVAMRATAGIEVASAETGLTFLQGYHQATKTVTFTGIAQVDTITLTGTSGTANVAVAGGLTKLATFGTDLATTAAAFVTSHAAAYLAAGIVVTSSGDDIIFTASNPGVGFSNPTITNATGDLAGSVANTQANAVVTDSAGDVNGTGNPATLFTVTGDVMVMVRAVCKATLVGAGTIEAGVVGATAALIAQIANATTLAVNEGWSDASPTLAEAFTPQLHTIGGGLDVIQTVGTADITNGQVTYYCFWKALSTDGNVVAA